MNFWEEMFSGPNPRINIEDLIGQTYTFYIPNAGSSQPNYFVHTDGSYTENNRTSGSGSWWDIHNDRWWAAEMIYSYDLVIPEDVIDRGQEDGAFVITGLDKVIGTDIALI